MMDAPTWAEFMTGWELGIYRDPILCGIAAGALLGYLGVFIVLRRMVFVTAAVSQAAGLGVVLAFYGSIHLGIEVHPVLGAIFLSLAATVVFVVKPEKIRLSREALLGLCYLGCWSGAVLFGDRISQEAHDIAAILFGTAVLVRPLDLILVVTVAALVLTGQVFGFRGFSFAAFDPEGARVQGLPVGRLDFTGWLMVAVAVAVCTRALGVLPVFAFAVLPAMSALLIADQLKRVLALAAVLGGVAGGAGYLFAFFLSFPVGASQAMVAFLIFLACLPIRLMLKSATASRRRGLAQLSTPSPSPQS